MSIFKVQNSGDKHTLKITPERGQLIPLVNMFHRLPDPAKGNQNPAHWHIKVKKG